MPKKAKKRRVQKGQKGVQAEEASAPVQAAGAVADAIPSEHPATEVTWWEKDMARSLKSWDFFEARAKARARSRRLPRA